VVAASCQPQLSQLPAEPAEHAEPPPPMQSVKAEAMGPRHTVARLSQVVWGPALQRVAAAVEAWSSHGTRACQLACACHPCLHVHVLSSSFTNIYPLSFYKAPFRLHPCAAGAGRADAVGSGLRGCPGGRQRLALADQAPQVPGALRLPVARRSASCCRARMPPPLRLSYSLPWLSHGFCALPRKQMTF
jgi:hypothetical protein